MVRVSHEARRHGLGTSLSGGHVAEAIAGLQSIKTKSKYVYRMKTFLAIVVTSRT